MKVVNEEFSFSQNTNLFSLKVDSNMAVGCCIVNDIIHNRVIIEFREFISVRSEPGSSEDTSFLDFEFSNRVSSSESGDSTDSSRSSRSISV